MFLHLSVILFTGVCKIPPIQIPLGLGRPPGCRPRGCRPLRVGQTPWMQTPPGLGRPHGCRPHRVGQTPMDADLPPDADPLGLGKPAPQMQNPPGLGRPPDADPPGLGRPPPPRYGSTSGRYASYWNAYLYFFCSGTSTPSQKNPQIAKGPTKLHIFFIRCKTDYYVNILTRILVFGIC